MVSTIEPKSCVTLSWRQGWATLNPSRNRFAIFGSCLKNGRKDIAMVKRGGFSYILGAKRIFYECGS